ncbi:unnamed protein product [Cunninghamella echinulata]
MAKFNFTELIKKLTHHHQVHQETDTTVPSEPTSTSSSKQGSRANSIYLPSSESPLSKKFLSDPMRTSSHPDYVGHYKDPMSCGVQSYHASYDVTNTGA